MRNCSTFRVLMCHGVHRDNFADAVVAGVRNVENVITTNHQRSRAAKFCRCVGDSVDVASNAGAGNGCNCR